MSKVKQGQSFLDKVLQQTGSVDNALQNAIDTGKSITDSLSIGKEFKSSVVTHNSVVAFFKANDEPATWLTENEENEITNVGIGAMIIEDNFIVR